jgi:hypothetical protein
MKWLCLLALLANLMLLAYAGYAFITVPESEVSRIKVDLQEKWDEIQAEQGVGSGEYFQYTEPEGEEMDLETLLQMQENEPATPTPEAPEERSKVRTYDIDYMEEPYARGDAQAQGVEDAKEKIKLNPLR